MATILPTGIQPRLHANARNGEGVGSGAETATSMNSTRATCRRASASLKSGIRMTCRRCREHTRQLREAKDLLNDARAMLADNWKKLPADATGLRQGIEGLLVEIERTKTCAWAVGEDKIMMPAQFAVAQRLHAGARAFGRARPIANQAGASHGPLSPGDTPRSQGQRSREASWPMWRARGRPRRPASFRQNRTSLPSGGQASQRISAIGRRSYGPPAAPPALR